MIKKVIAGILLSFCVFLWFFILSPNYDLLIGNGESMSPTLNQGDLIFIKSPGEKIKPGTIIVYDQYIPEEKKIIPITHRVVEVINGEILKTKGDANFHIDPWQVSISDVKGVYLFKIPYLGYLIVIIKEKLIKGAANGS